MTNQNPILQLMKLCYSIAGKYCKNRPGISPGSKYNTIRVEEYGNSVISSIPTYEKGSTTQIIINHYHKTTTSRKLTLTLLY